MTEPDSSVRWIGGKATEIRLQINVGDALPVQSIECRADLPTESDVHHTSLVFA